MSDAPGPDAKPSLKNEDEYAAPGWKNPYVIYVALMLVLFGFLILMGYLAWTQGWIPNRGTSGGAT